MCKIAVDRNGLAIQYVPDELKTPEMCKIAVSTDGVLLYEVPEKLRTLEVCKTALLLCSTALP